MNDIKTNLKTNATGFIADSLRRDCYGNIISKKLKKHKICFRDKLDKNNKIAEILNVVSYKRLASMIIFNFSKY